MGSTPGGSSLGAEVEGAGGDGEDVVVKLSMITSSVVVANLRQKMCA